MDCGPTCLRMIAQYYGRSIRLEELRRMMHSSREGVTLLNLNIAAEKLGFRTLCTRLTEEQLFEEGILPCILFWNQNHFVVLPPQKRRSLARGEVVIADPAFGMVTVTRSRFLQAWYADGDAQGGIALFLEPSAGFSEQEEEEAQKKSETTFSFLKGYLRPYRKYLAQLILGLVMGSCLSLILPFLTQSMVDYGINQQNVGFIYLVLAAQLTLFLGNTAIEIIRSWLLLHMNARINLAIISDFLTKLMRLPMRFFDTKMVGDITQRVNDQKRIEQFLTTGTLSTLFSMVNLLVFSIVLACYSVTVLGIFIVGSALAITWISIFLRKRATLDYDRFKRLSDNQSALFEIVNGMQEIKLNNCESEKRWGWEKLQARLFRVNMRNLALEQYQFTGSVFLTQLKNILISFVAAREVLEGRISLGMMLSISYITGQMNAPVEQLLGFLRSAQDARISLRRLQEIHEQEEEEREGLIEPDTELALMKQTGNGTLEIEDLTFHYGGPESPAVLKNINLKIPIGKVTAIVGASGSGKTTLMKLLLQFYPPSLGKVRLNGIPLERISPRWWRNQCGVVAQDGFIFSDSIARNIAVNGEPDQRQLLHALRMANLEHFVQSLPLSTATKVGNAGNGISAGQKQRLLIARAVYKDPSFIFLDEATSALDASNERVIIENLNTFFRNRTVVVIAHRLSTVKHADQIVVLDNGQIVEVGDHQSLTEARGSYYQLVKNQLELGQ